MKTLRPKEIKVPKITQLICDGALIGINLVVPGQTASSVNFCEMALYVSLLTDEQADWRGYNLPVII